ncbi:hypothetical protein BKA69DRAFT_366178 [Paraphysoderma sedebokerense]|nr:hypothetical protein BKA69DRAFT_366178 [Paraphysoderma sedebokerense]
MPSRPPRPSGYGHHRPLMPNPRAAGQYRYPPYSSPHPHYPWQNSRPAFYPHYNSVRPSISQPGLQQQQPPPRQIVQHVVPPSAPQSLATTATIEEIDDECAECTQYRDCICYAIGIIPELPPVKGDMAQILEICEDLRKRIQQAERSEIAKDAMEKEKAAALDLKEREIEKWKRTANGHEELAKVKDTEIKRLKVELTAKLQSINDHQNLTKDFRSEKIKMEEEFKSLSARKETEIHDLKTKVANAHRQIVLLNSDVAAKNHQISQRITYDRYKADMDRLNLELEKRKSDLASSERTLQLQTSSYSAIEDMLKSVVGNLENVENMLEIPKDTSTSIPSSIGQSIQTFNYRLDGVRTNLEPIIQFRQALNALAASDFSQETISQFLDSLKDHLDSNADVSSSTPSVHKYFQILNTLLKRLAARESKCSQSESALTAREAEIVEHYAEIDARNNQLNEAIEHFKQLQQQYTSEQNQLIDNMINECNARLLQFQTLRDQMANDYAAARNQVLMLQQNGIKQKKVIDQLKKHNQELGTRQVATENEREELHRKIELGNQRNQQLVNEMEKLKNENKMLKTLNDECNERFGNTKSRESRENRTKPSDETEESNTRVAGNLYERSTANAVQHLSSTSTSVQPFPSKNVSQSARPGSVSSRSTSSNLNIIKSSVPTSPSITEPIKQSAVSVPGSTDAMDIDTDNGHHLIESSTPSTQAVGSGTERIAEQVDTQSHSRTSNSTARPSAQSERLPNLSVASTMHIPTEATSKPDHLRRNTSSSTEDHSNAQVGPMNRHHSTDLSAITNKDNRAETTKLNVMKNESTLTTESNKKRRQKSKKKKNTATEQPIPKNVTRNADYPSSLQDPSGDAQEVEDSELQTDNMSNAETAANSSVIGSRRAAKSANLKRSSSQKGSLVQTGINGNTALEEVRTSIVKSSPNESPSKEGVPSTGGEAATDKRNSTRKRKSKTVAESLISASITALSQADEKPTRPSQGQKRNERSGSRASSASTNDVVDLTVDSDDDDFVEKETSKKITSSQKGKSRSAISDAFSLELAANSSASKKSHSSSTTPSSLKTSTISKAATKESTMSYSQPFASSKPRITSTAALVGQPVSSPESSSDDLQEILSLDDLMKKRPPMKFRSKSSNNVKSESGVSTKNSKLTGEAGGVEAILSDNPARADMERITSTPLMSQQSRKTTTTHNDIKKTGTVQESIADETISSSFGIPQSSPAVTVASATKGGSDILSKSQSSFRMNSTSPLSSITKLQRSSNSSMSQPNPVVPARRPREVSRERNPEEKKTKKRQMPDVEDFMEDFDCYND